MRYFLIVFAALASCADFEREKREHNTQTDVVKILQADDVSIDILPTKNAYIYTIRLIFKPVAQEHSVWVRCSRSEHNAIINSNTYVYSFTTFNENECSLSIIRAADILFKREIKIPRDFVFTNSNDVHLIQNTTIEANRVFFEENAQIFINQYDLSIVANELIVQSIARISTFRDQTIIAPPGTSGRSGGRLHIKTTKARGVLVVSMLGEHGVRGADAPNIYHNNPAQNGANGRNGEVYKHMECRETKPCQITNIYCIQEPEDGQNGHDGQDGPRGQDGGGGGNSGELRIDVKDESPDFKLNYIVLPGRGADGGAGAPGQRGGEGGAAGTKPPGPCKNNPKAGARGRDGKHGQPGAKGRDGIAQPVCVRINKRTEGQCENY